MNRRQFLQGTGLALSAFATGTATALSREYHRSDLPDYQKTGAKLITDSHAAADGFYFPAEWQAHEQTIMVLPPPQNWHGYYDFSMDEVRKLWAEVANTLSEYEPVLMVIRPQDRQIARKLFSSQVHLVELPVNDGWSRDTGPMFVVNGKGERRVSGCTFNNWGNKAGRHGHDILLKARLCKHLDIPMYPVDLVLEGGAVHFDGEGTLLTTEQCLLHKNRNPKLSKAEIEHQLHQAFGTKKIIWLGKGLEPDPITDGHVDGIAAFTAPGVVMLHMTDDRSDVNYEICRDAKRRLQNERDAQGRKLTIIELPLTKDMVHMNFYLGNGCVLVPTAGQREQDDRPLAIIQESFPKRKVIGIAGKVLSAGGGGIHCITQQVPKA